MKLFITQYAAGNNRAEELIIRELAATRKHTTQKVALAKTSIRTRLDTGISSAQETITSHTTISMNQATANIMNCVQDMHVREVTIKQRELLLQSLKFPAMNERRNQISDVLEGSFSKIFNLVTISDTESSDTDPSDAESSNAGSSDEDPFYFENHEDGNYNSTLFKHHDSLVSWMESDHSLFWVTGKPGSGKSTLAKFLLTSNLTHTALQSWDPNLKIISHFFWKPGTSMQSNSKGFLCSLLYQLLSFDEANINKTIAMNSHITAKDSVTDWSITELRNTLFESLSIRGHSLCIFIDGVDEVCDNDGPSTILALIDEIRNYQGIKICVFSRPEPCFRLQLATYPHLTVHELNSGDMLKYARSYLAPYWRDPYPEPKYDLFCGLIAKSEGVFLWLCLALRSLKEGVQNGDSKEELFARLEALPSDLSKMFLDMWERVNGKTGIYKKKAAQYFNLAIISQRQHLNGPHIFYRLCRNALSLCQLTAITEPSFAEVLRIKDPSSRNQKMEDFCQRTSKSIQIKTAGLLEVVPSPPLRRGCRPYTCDEICTCSTSAISQVVRFIHRTVYDFLQYTGEGQGILQWDDSSERQCLLQLAKGVFTEVRFGPINDAVVTIEHNLHMVSLIENDELRPAVHSLLEDCLRSYDEWSTNLFPEFGLHFLTHLTRYPRFFEFISTTIKRSLDPRALATRILGEALVSWRTSPVIGHQAVDLKSTLSLLRLGADPNAIFSPVPLPTVFLPNATAFIAYLQIAISCMQPRDPGGRKEDDCIENARLLGPFLRELLERNPNMDTKTVLMIELQNFVAHRPYSLKTNILDLQDSHYLDSCSLGIVVNTRLLLEVFLQRALSVQQLYFGDQIAWLQTDLNWAKSYAASLPSQGPEAAVLYFMDSNDGKIRRVLSGELMEPINSTISLIDEAFSSDCSSDLTSRVEAMVARESKGVVEEVSSEKLYSEMADDGLGIHIPE